VMKKRFTFNRPILLIFSLLFMGSIAYGQVGHLDSKQSVENGYDYIAYLPAGYDENSSKPWPVLIYLHGGQGILDGFNNDPNSQKALSNFTFGPPSLISNKLGFKKGSLFNTFL